MLYGTAWSLHFAQATSKRSSAFCPSRQGSRRNVAPATGPSCGKADENVERRQAFAESAEGVRCFAADRRNRRVVKPERREVEQAAD